ncbi:MAG: hypothetical protein IJ546_09170 [Prevotella sp.]|nr:hypothetical protein [Prevotella sp.]
MKRYLNWLGIALASLSMASCNLFIDDDTVNEMGFENVPVHTGEGYDEPVTVQDGEATITYQYKKNVRVLKPEDQKWIVYTEKEPTGTCYWIDYRSDTPKDLLPVKGEILVSTVTDKFEWGLNHLVLGSVTKDGVIRYAVGVANIADTFEELQMDGRVTTIDEEEYYTYNSDVDDSVVDLDENGYPVAGSEDSPSENIQGTRADDEEKEIGKVKFLDDGFDLNFSINHSVTVKLPHDISLSVSTNGSTMRVKSLFDVSGFDLSAGKYTIKIDQTVEEDFHVNFKGGWSGSKRIKRFKPIKGKSFTIGPVNLVLFVNIDIIVEGELSASFNLSKSQTQVRTYIVNLKEMTIEIEEDKEHTKDGSVKLDNVIIEGSIGLFAKIHLGLGLFTKFTSLKLIPKIGVQFSFKAPTYWNSDSETIYDIGEETGISISFPLSGQLGFFAGVEYDSFLDVGGDMFDQYMSVANGLLYIGQKYVGGKAVDWFNSLIDSDGSDYDPSQLTNEETVKDNDTEEGESSNELAFASNFGPYNPIPGFHVAWFPTMEKNSFKIIKSWDEENEQLNFKGEFQCAGIGVLATLGTQYVPALQIWNGSEMIDVVWPDEGGKLAKLEAEKTYHFTIKNSDEDVVYYARPCYYARPLGMKQNPDALDKSLPFCAYTPMISITDMKPTYAGPVAYDTEGRYIYSFNFDLYTSVKGISNVGSFGLEDVLNAGKYNHTYKAGSSDKQLRDGTYVLKYMVKIHSKAESRQLKMNLRPWLTIPEGGVRYGSDYGFIISTECWYRTWNAQTNEKGKKKDFKNAQASRQSDWFDDGDTDVDDGTTTTDGEQMEVILQSIETPQGEVIWERTPAAPLKSI